MWRSSCKEGRDDAARVEGYLYSRYRLTKRGEIWVPNSTLASPVPGLGWEKGQDWTGHKLTGGGYRRIMDEQHYASSTPLH